MFNVSRSLMPSAEEVSEHVYLCMWSVCVRPRVRRFDVRVSFQFFSQDSRSFSTSFCSRYLNLTHKTGTFVSFIFSPLQPFLFLPVCSSSLSALSSLVDGLRRCLFVVSQGGNSAYTLRKHTFCNHQQLISHSLSVSFCLIAALVLVMLTAASYSHADLLFPSNTETKRFNCTWHFELML